MIIVGVTGGIGHGKTTFANFLAAQARSHQHFETWEIVGEVADGLRSSGQPHPRPDDMAAINNWLLPLPDIIAASVHVNTDFNTLRLTTTRAKKRPENYQKLFEYLQTMADQPALQEVDITVDNKAQFRPLLQWLGGYLVSTLGGVWYDEIVRRIRVLQSGGCELVTVGGVRYPGDAESLRNAGGTIIEIKRAGRPLQDVADITERERNLITADTLIENDGTLEQLASCAAKVYEQLRLRQADASYRASAF